MIPCHLVGLGRAANGNFVLSEFSANILPAAAQDKETPVVFKAVTTDYSQAGWPVASALDRKQDTGWGIAGGDRQVAFCCVYNSRSTSLSKEDQSLLLY